MQVTLKRPNGWKIQPRKVESHDDVQYARVKISKIKQVAVYVAAPGTYRCSKCDRYNRDGMCKHEKAVADKLSRVDK